MHIGLKLHAETHQLHSVIVCGISLLLARDRTIRVTTMAWLRPGQKLLIVAYNDEESMLGELIGVRFIVYVFVCD